MKAGLVALIALALGAAAPPPDDAAMVAWVAAQGHRLPGPEPDAAELAPLLALLRGARVVGLGEVTHGTHEDLLVKAALVRALVADGAIDTLALEANRVVGVALDGYVRRGEGDPVTLLLAPSVFRIFRNAEFADLLLWLRAWNLAHPGQPVGITAVDNQDGAVDANAALAFIEARDAGLARRLRAGFGAMLPPPGGARVRPSDWLARHDRVEAQRLLGAAAMLGDAFTVHADAWRADPGYAEAAYAARVAWQNFHVFEFDVAGVDPSKLPGDVMSRRDRHMAQNLLDRLGGSGRAALWAHNAHVMHTFPANWRALGYVSVGTALRGRIGTGYRAVGTTYTRATVLATRIDGRQQAAATVPPADVPLSLANDGPATSGGTLAALPGDVWWFDPAAAHTDPGVRRWLAAPRWGGETGWMVDPATFQRGRVADDGAPFDVGFDAVVWIRTLTQQHRWPVATAPRTP